MKKTEKKFKQVVFEIVERISKGTVMTYKEVATAAGRPKACRAVGNILHTNFNPDIPCHRVIRSDGKIGGYNQGPQKKQYILKQEGIKLHGKD